MNKTKCSYELAMWLKAKGLPQRDERMCLRYGCGCAIDRRTATEWDEAEWGSARIPDDTDIGWLLVNLGVNCLQEYPNYEVPRWGAIIHTEQYGRTPLAAILAAADEIRKAEDKADETPDCVVKQAFEAVREIEALRGVQEAIDRLNELLPRM